MPSPGCWRPSCEKGIFWSIQFARDGSQPIWVEAAVGRWRKVLLVSFGPRLCRTEDRREGSSGTADPFLGEDPRAPKDHPVGLASWVLPRVCLRRVCAVALLNTYSGHLAMEPSNRRKLYPEVRRLIGARPDCRIRKH